MDAALNYGIDTGLSDLVANFKITNVENMIEKMFEKMPMNKPLDYIGKLNQTDVMF
mgnify:CR=1 FL=1